jgi:hypothetical protein
VVGRLPSREVDALADLSGRFDGVTLKGAVYVGYSKGKRQLLVRLLDGHWYEVTACFSPPLGTVVLLGSISTKVTIDVAISQRRPKISRGS